MKHLMTDVMSVVFHSLGFCTFVFMSSSGVAMPAGSLTTFNSRSTEMIAQAVTFFAGLVGTPRG